MRQCDLCNATLGTARSCPICELALAPAARARVGGMIAAFAIDAVVAVGPIATVYRARRGADPVALKVYPPGIQEAEAMRRIAREGQAQAQVDHPFVAKLLDCGRLPDGSAFLASEWIEGASLEDRLAAGPVPWSELFGVVAAIAAGLAAIHQVGIVHRDLKPANVMLPGSRKRPAVIVDFGHSLVLDEGRLTQSGFTVGSAAYMAPEQAAGGELDPRADLYSLGVILYRGLTGTLPHETTSAAEMMRLRTTEPVVPPRTRAPERAIAPAIEDLALWLLSTRPAERPPSARVLLNTLRYVAARPAEMVA